MSRQAGGGGGDTRLGGRRRLPVALPVFVLLAALGHFFESDAPSITLGLTQCESIQIQQH